MKIIILLFFVGKCYCFEHSEHLRNFSIEILHHTQLETNGHIVVSPLGLWTVMTEVTLGATGDSQKQLRRALRLPRNLNKIVTGHRDFIQVLNSTTEEVTFTSKNFMFLDTDIIIDPIFKEIIRDGFDATVTMLDFKGPNSVNIVNNYTSNDRISIRLVLDDLNSSKMILSNVMSFSGLWSSPFDKKQTSVEPFYNENKKIAGRVNMMYQRGFFPFSNIQSLKAFVVELPYGTNRKYSMLITLPHPNTNIAEMYMKFANVTLTDVLKTLETDIDTYGLKEIDIKIPRFKISTNVVMDKPLNNIGIYDIFKPLHSSFGKMAPGLFTLAVVHKADIEVTELGTIASGAIPAVLSDNITPTPSFLANRPFVYFIIEKSTTTVILCGIYSEPSIY